jgi:hypothetical protein
MKRVTVIDPLEDSRWDAFVHTHPLGSIFHTSDWARVLLKTFSCRPFYLALEDGDKITGGLPFMQINSLLTGNRLISLPRTSYCDPLAENGEDLTLLVDAAIKLRAERHSEFLEIKTQKCATMSTDRKLKEYGHFKNQILCLAPGLDDIWKGFDRTCIRQRISRAQKSGVKIRVGGGMEDLRGFYALHRQSTRKHAVPRRPFSFFRNMSEILGPKHTMLLVMAEVGTRLGSAAVFLKSKDSLIFEFLGNNYQLMDHSPVHLIVWEMIQYAIREGLRYFDFGLTPPDNVGLIKFKSRWGAEERVLKYYYQPDVAGYKRFITSCAEPESNRNTKLPRMLTMLKCSIASRLYSHFG